MPARHRCAICYCPFAEWMSGREISQIRRTPRQTIVRARIATGEKTDENVVKAAKCDFFIQSLIEHRVHRCLPWDALVS